MTTAIDTIVLSSAASLSQPDVTRLTTKSVEGTGVFDVLMAAIKEHLLEEYTADRITGDEYSKVYLGAMQGAMQTAVQYLLNSQQEEKIQAEIALTRQKTVTELAQTDNDIPVGLGFNGDSLVEGIVKAQKDKLASEETLIASQIDQSNAQIALTGQKIVTELAQTSDSFTKATVAGYGFNGSSVLAGLLNSEKEKINAETSYTEQRTVTELANTSDTKPVDLGEMTGTTAITGLVEAQKDKTSAEVILLAQKANTELAQTADTVKIGAPYLNTLSTVTGVISKQKNLYSAQTDGFSRDAEQKVLKIMADTWSVSATQGEATANSTNGLDDSSLGAVVNKAKNGIGIS